MNRLFNPNDWFGQHQGITLVLIALAYIAVSSL